MADACNECCGEQNCASPELRCATVSASASKNDCGFQEFSSDDFPPSTPPKFYLKRETKETDNSDSHATYLLGTYQRTRTSVKTTTETVDPATCETTTECAGEATETGSESLAPVDETDDGIDNPTTYTCSTSASWNPCTEVPDGLTDCGYIPEPNPGCDGTPDVTVFPGIDSNTHSKTGSSDSVTCGGDGDGTISGTSTGELSTEVTLSEEYMTDDLKGGISFDDFPEMAGCVSGVELAYSVLSEDETDYIARKGKYRWRIRPQPLCAFKITWIERFTPTDEDEDPVDTEMEWEWTGTGNPCASGGSGTFAWDDEDTWPESPEYSIDIPAGDGSVTIEEVKWTCIPGQEPTGEGEPA
jgi:hypothetical protein